MGIAGEVSMSYIIGFDISGQGSWTFKNKSVIKHLNLYFSATNCIISMAFRVDREFLQNEMGIFSFCYEPSVMAKIRRFVNLQFE